MNWAPPRVGTRLTWALIALALCAALGAAQSRDERAVRAAYVFNLTKYVEWPAAKNELVIGFVGSPETGEVMQKMLDGKRSESRIIHVLLFPSDEELKKCSLVYIGDSPKKIRPLLDKFENTNVLTVGEAESFARDGGIVGLVRVGDQVQIQVNLEAAQHAGIKISSRLLSLAQIVRPAPGARN